MDSIRVEAKTVADAVTEASIQLGTSSDNIEYTVISEGSRGFFGIGGKKAVIEKNVGGRWEWEAVGESKFAVNGNKLELAIAKQLMNLTGDDVDIEFKWNDNMQENGNIMDFYVNGDTAPGGRFNYVYTTK